MKFVAATCPTCGGNLQIPADLTLAKCAYCGADVVMAWESSDQSKLPHLCSLARTSFNADNYGEALGYFNQILEINSNLVGAWIGKAWCTVYLSPGDAGAFEQALAYLKHAEILAPDDNQIHEAREGITYYEVNFELSVTIWYEDWGVPWYPSNTGNWRAEPDSSHRKDFATYCRLMRIATDEDQYLYCLHQVVCMMRERQEVCGLPLLADLPLLMNEERKRIVRRVGAEKADLLEQLEQKKYRLTKAYADTSSIWSGKKRAELDTAIRVVWYQIDQLLPALSLQCKCVFQLVARGEGHLIGDKEFREKHRFEWK